MINILLAATGFFVVLFLPGYLLSLLMLPRLRISERLAMSLGLSVFVVVLFSFLFTIIGSFSSAGLITGVTVWLSMAFVCSALGALYLARRRQ